jgi:hypothetical protein
VIRISSAREADPRCAHLLREEVEIVTVSNSSPVAFVYVTRPTHIEASQAAEKRCFVSGQDFSRAASDSNTLGFSP